ncbi:TlpA family protein disulfide reductase [Chryseobacterium sp. SIMBA_038]|uniref:TlpA family protein disulfide reductase n=1 Tax=Chryseobacterium sp. SIMBA_038 TaxID=3085780 RepID=UPI00397D69D8
MGNKKFLKISAVIVPVVLIGVIVYLFLNLQNKKEKIEALKNAPTLSLKTIDQNIFTEQNLADDRTKIIIYFSPSCHFCQAEAEELSKNIQDTKNIQWIWVASESLNEIKEFAVKYNLDKQSNIFWCHDEMATLYRKLGMSSVPYFLVYDKNNHLTKRNSGAIKLEKLINPFDEKK